MNKCIKCGSYAFNLYKEGIDQGGLCDVHYWQGRAHRAETIAQPEQEPVAYIHRNEYNEYRLEPHDNFDIKSIPFNVDVSLFKSPQRTWVGLTDEEMHECAGEYPWTPTGLKCCRAIEAKLKEKNMNIFLIKGNNNA